MNTRTHAHPPEITCSILVIDEDEEVRERIVQATASLGYHVDLASSFSDALPCLRSCQPDMMLCRFSDQNKQHVLTRRQELNDQALPPCVWLTEGTWVQEADFGVEFWSAAVGLLPRQSSPEEIQLYLQRKLNTLSRSRNRPHRPSVPRTLSPWIDIYESDSSRLAGEISQGLGQSVAGALMMLESLIEAREQGKPAELDSVLAGIHACLADAHRETQLMMHSLYPVAQQKCGLVAGLTALCAQLSLRWQLPIHFEADDAYTSPSRDLEQQLFRLAQALLGHVVGQKTMTHLVLNLQGGTPGLGLELIAHLHPEAPHAEATLLPPMASGQYPEVSGFWERLQQLQGAYETESHPEVAEVRLRLRIPAL